MLVSPLYIRWSLRILSFGCTPGSFLYRKVGVVCAVASSIRSVHLFTWSSILSKVCVTKLGLLKSVSSSLYLVQSVRWNCRLGLIGIWIGSAEIVAIIGRWSDGVRGPCDRWKLWNALLLDNTMSGVVEQLSLMKVGKSGPSRKHLSLSIIRAICLPGVFEELDPRRVCRAFKSPKSKPGGPY